MSEIKIIDFMPIIITKDKSWRPRVKVKPGAILYLPADAILLKPVEKTYDTSASN